MNHRLQTILDLIVKSAVLSDDEKKTLSQRLAEADKEFEITALNLNSTEKLNRTTAILLEETMAELEQKKRAVEEKNRELEIESSLERVRTVAMDMNKPDDMPDVCKTISLQLESLGVKDIRNVQTAIFYENRGTYMNYEYYARHHKTLVTETLYTNHEVATAFANKMLQGKGEIYTTHIEGEKVRDWLAYQKTTNVFIDTFLETATSLNYYWRSLGPVALGVSTYSPLAKDELNLFQRFLNVFELAYTRYLDIEQAVTQAREAQIQLALERVRAVAMAMKQSAELISVCEVMYKELASLGFSNIRNAQIAIENNIKQSYCFYVYSDFEKIVAGEAAYNSSPVVQRLYNELGKSGDGLYEREYSPAEMEEWRNWRKSLVPFLDNREETAASLCWYMYAIGNGHIGISTFNALTAEQVAIVKRFKKVFELSYTRFDDLKKAEAQSREAQIELALERVRARTMAMQKSDELAETASLLFNQINDLGIQTWTSGFNIWEKDDTSFIGYNPTPSGGITSPYRIPSTEDNFFKTIYEAKKAGEDFLVFESAGESLADTYVYMKTLPVVKDVLNGIEQAGFELPKYQVNHCVFFAQGFLLFITTEAFPNAHDIFKRFGKLFEQTYTRFLDLQKAEAQARESQIQLALERVRARTMAMQHSDELAEVAAVLFQQVKALGVPQWVCGFSIFEIDDKECTWYPGSADGDILPPAKIPLTEHPVFISYNESRKRGDELYIYEKTGEVQADHYRYLMSLPGIRELGQKMLDAGLTFPTFQIDHLANFSHGNLVFITYEPVPEMHDVFKRFAKVFEQTYTRFLDLQKAEAQAREAQIEAALERVRSKAMAMQKSEDLADAVAIVFEELDKLNLGTIRCGIAIHDKEKRSADLWTAALSEKGTIAQVSGDELMDIHPLLQGAFDAWLQQKNYSYLLQGQDLVSFYKALSKANYKLPDSQFIEKTTDELQQHLYVAHFPAGGLYAFREKAFTEEARVVIRRFADVFNQTYTRYNDLKQAEAQVKEAIKQASVDRVRAEIASMRTTNDLERITPLIWNELTTLGVPFIRCGMFIMDDQQQQVQTHLSTPDGKAIAGFRLPYYATEQTTQIVTHWQQKKIYKDHMDEAAFAEYTKNLVLQGAVTSGEKYLIENRPTDLYLHFLPFLQGMLYTGNTAPLSDDELHLAQNLADAFSTAYARYEDFNKLESAKVQIEKTLVDLKQTQSQLIQSEKMASLGELTAGIAHEIQNPLNFVNNFSDVNRELLGEMNEEIEKKNYDDAKAIAKDITENEEKINHHGKRADAIVKGMLQHSRSSTGQKEPTDINALADEYLRLAYHGLRAKDKEFNATLKTDYDQSIGNVNIIPQDIGRVLLNLINNAFYAVNEKKKQVGENYEPTVFISTKKINDKVEITVADNGNGIPQKVVDKIFQPFFTTKPTGEGTGLGLSLSYDIVKAHGGELNVITKEGEKSEFIIQLPVV